ncbi:unnamed protein product, partial [Prorocentrum cordatum]
APSSSRAPSRSASSQTSSEQSAGQDQPCPAAAAGSLAGPVPRDAPSPPRGAACSEEGSPGQASPPARTRTEPKRGVFWRGDGWAYGALPDAAGAERASSEEDNLPTISRGDPLLVARYPALAGVFAVWCVTCKAVEQWEADGGCLEELKRGFDEELRRQRRLRETAGEPLALPDRVPLGWLCGMLSERRKRDARFAEPARARGASASRSPRAAGVPVDAGGYGLAGFTRSAAMRRRLAAIGAVLAAALDHLASGSTLVITWPGLPYHPILPFLTTMLRPSFCAVHVLTAPGPFTFELHVLAVGYQEEEPGAPRLSPSPLQEFLRDRRRHDAETDDAVLWTLPKTDLLLECLGPRGGPNGFDKLWHDFARKYAALGALLGADSMEQARQEVLQQFAAAREQVAAEAEAEQASEAGGRPPQLEGEELEKLQVAMHLDARGARVTLGGLSRPPSRLSSSRDPGSGPGSRQPSRQLAGGPPEGDAAAPAAPGGGGPQAVPPLQLVGLPPLRLTCGGKARRPAGGGSGGSGGCGAPNEHPATLDSWLDLSADSLFHFDELEFEMNEADQKELESRAARYCDDGHKLVQGLQGQGGARGLGRAREAEAGEDALAANSPRIKRSWKSLWSDAEKTEADTSAGVVIFAMDWIGLRVLQGGELEAANKFFANHSRMDWTCIVVLSRSAGEQVSSQLAELSTHPVSSAVNLGVDFTAGRAVKTGGQCAKLKSRLTAARRARAGNTSSLLSLDGVQVEQQDVELEVEVADARERRQAVLAQRLLAAAQEEDVALASVDCKAQALRILNRAIAAEGKGVGECIHYVDDCFGCTFARAALAERPGAWAAAAAGGPEAEGRPLRGGGAAWGAARGRRVTFGEPVLASSAACTAFHSGWTLSARTADSQRGGGAPEATPVAAGDMGAGAPLEPVSSMEAALEAWERCQPVGYTLPESFVPLALPGVHMRVPCPDSDEARAALARLFEVPEDGSAPLFQKMLKAQGGHAHFLRFWPTGAVEDVIVNALAPSCPPRRCRSSAARQVWKMEVEGAPQFFSGQRQDIHQDSARTAPGQRQDNPRTAPGQRQDTPAARTAPGQRQDSARTAPGQRQDSARTASGQRQDSARTAPGQRQDSARTAARTAPGQRQDSARTAPGQRQDSARTAPGQRQDSARTAPGQRQERQRQDSARTAPGQRQDSARTAPGQRQDSARTALGQRQDSARTAPGQRQDSARTAP